MGSLKLKVCHIGVILILFLVRVHVTRAQNLEYSNICPKNEIGLNPTHLPHPSNCTKFYKCDRGVAYIQECPEGLHWSVEADRCDWPLFAKCLSSISPSTNNIKNDSDYFMDKNSGNCSYPFNSSISYLCENGGNGILLPYPGNCSKFVACSNGKAFAFECPIGLEWHNAIKQCDYPKYSDCHVYNQSSINNSTPSTNEGSYQFNTTNSGPGFQGVNFLASGPVLHPGCPTDEDPSNPTLLPYPGDCNKFYKCLGGYAYALRCPPGLEWSTQFNRCEWPGVANCTWGNNMIVNPFFLDKTSTILEGRTSQKKVDKNVKCPTNENFAPLTQFSYPGDCTKFYKCFNGEPYTMDCPAGLYWNEELKICDWPSNVKCNNNIFISSFRATSTTGKPINHPQCSVNQDPDNPIQLPYPGDCTKFYKCSNGLAYPQDCPAGLEWNNDLKVCDWPSVAGCKNYLHFNVIAFKDSTSLIKNCPLSDDPENPVHLPNPKDCSKFFKCSHGLAYSISCPSGQHWSAKLNRCDWPEVAKCNSVVISNKPSFSTASPPSSLQLPTLSNLCKATSDNDFLAYPKDCAKYIRCVGGHAFVQNCPPGLAFNVKEQICDYPHSANCQEF